MEDLTTAPHGRPPHRRLLVSPHLRRKVHLPFSTAPTHTQTNACTKRTSMPTRAQPHADCPETKHEELMQTRTVPTPTNIWNSAHTYRHIRTPAFSTDTDEETSAPPTNKHTQ